MTAYTSKQQPHMQNLWQLLQDGQARLDAELQAQPDADIPYRAKRALMRMLVSCQRRQRKSFQEMIAYLLDFPEEISSHAFAKLNFRPALVAADLCRSPSVQAAAHTAVLHSAADDGLAGELHIHMSTPHLNYQHRGAVLAAWPWYFYTAGVRRVAIQQRMDASERHLFDAAHPNHDRWLQHILTRQAWSVPLLIGPSIPSKTSD